MNQEEMLESYREAAKKAGLDFGSLSVEAVNFLLTRELRPEEFAMFVRGFNLGVALGKSQMSVGMYD